MTTETRSTPTGSIPTDPAAADDRLAPGSKLLIGLLLVSAFVVILNETIMGVALPRLMEDLDITASSAQWLTTGFMLTMAVIIPATGFLLERFSLRTMFITAMVLFSAGTLIAALSPGFNVLLIGRVVQASGTAIMMPLLMTTVLNVVPVNARGRTMGAISIVISVAPAIGPTVSGLILSVLDWRWMFWIVLPIALISLILGAVLVRNVTEPRRVRFDAFSLVLSAFAFGGLIFGLSSIGESAEGHAPMPVWVPLAVGVLALVAFIMRQRGLAREDRAFMDLRTFANRTFTVSIILVAIVMMALFGSLIVLPIYLQSVLQLDTLSTGLLLLPGGATMAALAPLVGSLFDRFGPRPLVIPGAFAVSGALWMLTTLGEESAVGMVIAVHVLLSAGLAFMFTPLLTSALGSLRAELYPHGSAIVGTVQQLAGAAGTALFITMMSTTAAARVAAGSAPLDATAAGVQAAFLCGAVLSLLAVVASFLIRRPAEPIARTHGGH
ncbi:DHA2 family efflux MFS transporter permease subunit [Plantibacter flavus]|uniref:DHA2 family efflux MFS transporter permease subunit n=1 Tax=Plantibacter flavus TaxID=150123 RepID=UPI003F172156